MTPRIQAFVRDLVRRGAVDMNGNTLEIGSMDINGNVRQYFHGPYLGVDMREGPCVDMVANAHYLGELASNSYDTVLCLEMLEHDDAFWLTAQEIIRLVKKPGGVVVVTAPGNGFPHHEYPSDYWRFTADGLKALFRHYAPGAAIYGTESGQTVFTHVIM